MFLRQKFGEGGSYCPIFPLILLGELGIVVANWVKEEWTS